MRLRTQAPVDVCVVGSGAGGGMTAYALTRAGLNVTVLEAGGPWDNATDSAMFTWPYDSPRRGASTRATPWNSVSVVPGQTASTRTPSGATSRASASLQCRTNAFVAP